MKDEWPVDVVRTLSEAVQILADDIREITLRVNARTTPPFGILLLLGPSSTLLIELPRARATDF